MPRRLDVPRPRPAKAALTPACRRAQAKYAAICTRSPKHGKAYQMLFDLTLAELDARDKRRA
jgi:hypothetical protein